MPVYGPFETTQQLSAATRPLRAALHAADPENILTTATQRARAGIRVRFLLDAFADAGVGYGSCDLAVLRSLAGSTVETLVTIADWLARANAAGNVELLADAAEYITPCPPPGVPGGDCEHGRWTRCERTDLAWRLRGLDPVEARVHAVQQAAGARDDG